MAIGDIIGIIATHEFDPVLAHYPSITQIDANLHALAYRGPDDDGWSRSVNITAAGAISEPASNTLEYDTDRADYCQACRRPDDILCVPYLKADNNRYLTAIIVNPDGTLSQHANKEVQFALNAYVFDRPMHRAGSTIAIAYHMNNGRAHVSTMSVSELGEVGATPLDDFEVMDNLSGSPSMAQVKDAVHVLMYQGPTTFGYARSVNISEAGVISATGDPQVQINAIYNYMNHIIRLKDNTMLCVHRGPDSDGWASVLQCTDAGVITVPTNNTYEFDAAFCDQPWALRLSDDVFAVVYAGPGPTGYLKTLKCEVGSAATWTPIGSLQFEVGNCQDPKIFLREHNVYTIVYSGPLDDGFLKTVEITSPLPTEGHTEMSMGIGP